MDHSLVYVQGLPLPCMKGCDPILRFAMADMERRIASMLRYHTSGMDVLCMHTELHMQYEDYCVSVDAPCKRTQMLIQYHCHCLSISEIIDSGMSAAKQKPASPACISR